MRSMIYIFLLTIGLASCTLLSKSNRVSYHFFSDAQGEYRIVKRLFVGERLPPMEELQKNSGHTYKLLCEFEVLDVKAIPENCLGCAVSKLDTVETLFTFYNRNAELDSNYRSILLIRPEMWSERIKFYQFEEKVILEIETGYLLMVPMFSDIYLWGYADSFAFSIIGPNREYQEID